MAKPNKQKAIGIVEVRSFRCLPAKHIDLLPQDQIFRLQLCSRPTERSQDAKEQLEQISHQAQAYPVRSRRLRRIEFSVHTKAAHVHPHRQVLTLGK
jgi:hypothetical protein